MSSRTLAALFRLSLGVYKRRGTEEAFMALKSVAIAYRRALARWTDGVRRLAKPVVAVSIAATVAAAGYLALNVHISTNTDDMLSAELPFRKNAAALKRAFPMLSNNIAIVIDGQTPDLADDGAQALTVKLAENPKLFGNVFDPEGSPFFRKHGFLYLDKADLIELSDKLAKAQPFLGTLWHDPSLVGLFKMLGLAIDEALKEKGAQPIEIVKVLDAMTDVVKAQVAGRFQNLSWQELMSGEKDDDILNRRIVLIQPALDFASLQPAAAAMAELRRLTRELGLTPDNGVTVRLTGSAAMEHEELKSVTDGMGLAGLLSLALVIGLLAIGLRSPRLVMATLATLLVGLIWTAAIAILMLDAFNLISVAFAVLFIGLSVDFGIHYGLRYQEGLDRGDSHEAALAEASEGVGGALTLCAVGAAIAFYSFLPTDYVGLAELGLIAGTGMFVAFFANLTVLPALLTVMPVPAGGGHSRPSAFGPLTTGLRSFLHRRARVVCGGALILGVAAVAALPKATFDSDPLNLRDPKTESVSTFLDLKSDTRTRPYTITVLADSLSAARDTAAKLETLPEVDDTLTLADFVPGNQQEKFDIIGAMGLFLMPAFATAGSADEPSVIDRLNALADFQARLQALAGMTDRPESSAAKDLGFALAELFRQPGDDGRRIKDLEHRMLAALPGRLQALNAALSAGPVMLEELPSDLKARYVAADGRARLVVYPKDDMQDRAALGRFVAAVRTLAPAASGAPVIILEAGKAVLKAFWQAAALSVVLIVVLLLVVLDRRHDVVLIFVPLVLAALLTVAASVLLGRPFNFANVIVLPLLFGLGVASGIHLVIRERESVGANSALETSTPRAVVFSALTTIGSFGSIAISSHPGTASMGVLLAIAITLTMACTLIVLPALIQVTGEGPGGKA